MPDIPIYYLVTFYFKLGLPILDNYYHFLKIIRGHKEENKG